ncbi:MAG: epoxyqueuosine reductase, partial [Deltaproteobacteria bacterium]|nr:epoxyqueuosine reductase [Deltaproteobacteria bacterium]
MPDTELSRLVLDYVKCEGACAAGIATVDTLAGGPPSADMTYVLPGAKSAVCFA